MDSTVHYPRKAVFLFGPTGVGKTRLAVDIARGRCEIISVDSMQVYRDMEIGTAKPGPGDLERVAHHLVSIVEPDYRFSAGDFKRLALGAIDDITGRGKIPLLVGGTGLYFRALESRLGDAPPADLELRRSLYREEEKSRGALHRRLLAVDPETADRLHPNDVVRVVRALEIFTLTGKTFSRFTKMEVCDNLDVLKIGVTIEREELYARLENRCERMIDSGLGVEVYGLLSSGCDERCPSMKGIGYSHFIDYFKGCFSFDETVRRFKRDTRRYAKRQLTWFRREKDVRWFDPRDVRGVSGEIDRFFTP